MLSKLWIEFIVIWIINEYRVGWLDSSIFSYFFLSISISLAHSSFLLEIVFVRDAS